MKSYLLNHPNPEIRALAAKVADYLRSNAPLSEKVHAVAEVVTPILTDRIFVEDIWAGVLDEQDWTGTRPEDRKFRVPTEFLGHTKILTYREGMTFPQFHVNRRQITVDASEIATPEFTIDPRELEREDPLVSIEDIEEGIRRMFLMDKATQGYQLLTNGFDDPTTGTGNVVVVTDDGTYGSDDQRVYLRVLRDTIEERVQKLQASFGGRPEIKLVSDQLTLDRQKRIGLSADWAGFLQESPEKGPERKPALQPRLKPFTFPAMTTDINGDAAKGRAIITEGDLLMVGPNAAAVALAEPLQASVVTKDHWQVAYAWRAGYAWVRWSDKGDKNKIVRILVLKRVGVDSEPRGVLTLDSLTSDGARFYCTRPVNKGSISNTTVVVSATTGGAAATGALTTVMRGDLRHFQVNFATPLTPGTNYFIRTTTGVLDLAGDTVTATAEFQQVCP